MGGGGCGWLRGKSWVLAGEGEGRDTGEGGCGWVEEVQAPAPPTTHATPVYGVGPPGQEKEKEAVVEV